MNPLKKVYTRIFPASKRQANCMIKELQMQTAVNKKIFDKLRILTDTNEKIFDKLRILTDTNEKIFDEQRTQAAANKKIFDKLQIQTAEGKKMRSDIEALEKIIMAQTEDIRKVKGEVQSIKYEMNQLSQMQKRRTPVALLNFSYHLSDSCNLNCKCCDHFSPIAKERLADLNEFQKDMKRLGELCNGYVRRISLQGGEPLLHPDAVEFAVIARKNFPVGQIAFVTNGILLLKQSEDFWEKCSAYHIAIEITKYPIGLDYESIKKKAETYGVVCSFFGNTGQKDKHTYRIPLDLNGSQDIYDSFAKCFHANSCIFLKNGRLYPCTIAPNIEHFNEYFDQNLYLSERDSIDIYQVNSLEEITDFLSKPIPFCRYCDVNGREFGLEWRKSEKRISEWANCNERNRGRVYV